MSGLGDNHCKYKGDVQIILLMGCLLVLSRGIPMI